MVEAKLREHRHNLLREVAADPREGLRCGVGGASIRLLLVDDSEDDRSIALRELNREFPDLSVTEVCCAESLEAALKSPAEFDLLITDYQLVWSDGIRVIHQVRQRWPELPVIMVTGSGNEEIAVQAMKAGVYDYVQKTPKHYARLSAAVRGALHQRQHARELAAAEARYTTLFDTVPVGLFRSTPQGRLLDVNPAFALLLERDRDELVGSNFAQLHPHPGDLQAWREQLEREGSVTWVESRFRTASGKIRWVKIHAKALRESPGGDIIYEGSVEDVTSAKDAEAEREKLIADLQEALGRVRTLTGLLPICSSCKKIRDDHGRWNMLETFIENHSHAHFTHGFCPECAQRLYPEVFLDRPKF
jgi:PAS domain S-box-containing protein